MLVSFGALARELSEAEVDTELGASAECCFQAHFPGIPRAFLTHFSSSHSGGVLGSSPSFQQAPCDRCGSQKDVQAGFTQGS